MAEKKITTSARRYVKLTHNECEKVKNILNDKLQELFKNNEKTEEYIEEIEELIDLRSKFRKFKAKLG